MPITVPVDFDANAQGLERDLDRSVKSASNSAAREFTRGGDRAGQGFLSGFKKIAGPLAAIGAGAVATDFLKGAIDGASDLQESTTKIAAIFGDAQKEVQAFADTGAKALGQSKLEVLDAAATFGTFGKAAGLGGKDLAKFSTGFASLSTDFASFFNASPEEAVEAIGSALRGEAEPIRKFGVLLDDATLRSEALRLGLIKTTKQALTPQQKVLAAQAAIYRQTGDAQGDFERTSDGLANQQRILRAQFIDIRSELGAKLLPVVTDVVSGVSDLITEFQNGTGTGGEIRDVLEDVGEALQLVGEFGKGVYELFDSLPGPIKSTVIQLGFAYGGLRLLQSITGPLGTGFKNLTTNLGTAEGRVKAVGKAAYATGALARQAAGAGGLLLFTKGMQEADDTASTFYQTLGGAAAGFAIGGPVGGAVGAIGGFTTAVLTSDDATKDQVKSLGDYGEALDAVTGKLTENAQAIILQEAQKSNPNLLPAARAVGLSDSDIAKFIAGDKKVQASVLETLNIAKKAGTQVRLEAGGSVDAFGVISQSLQGTITETADGVVKVKGLTDEFASQAKEVRDNAKEMRQLRSALKGLPKEAKTKFTNDDTLDLTLSDVEKLADKYDKTPKQIKTLVAAAGLTPTNAEMKVLLDRSKTLKDFRARPKVDKGSIASANAAAGDLLSTLIDASKDRTANIYVKATFNDAKFDKLLSFEGRATGGPVKKGQPYIVGENRPEIFVPNENGRIIPKVPTSTPVQSTVDPNSPAASLVINQNYYGPTTGRERLSELDWTLRYSTRARGTA